MTPKTRDRYENLLPEAQLDRFLLQLHLGYPDPPGSGMLERIKEQHPIDTIQTGDVPGKLLSSKAVRQVHVDPDIVRYIVDIVDATRSAPGIYLGASPRGSIALFRTAQALAFIRGRSYVVPDDVKELVPFTLSHRMMLTSEARLSGMTVDRVLRDILTRIPVPVLPEEGRFPR